MTPISAISAYRTIMIKNRAGKEVEMKVKSELLDPNKEGKAVGKFNFSGIDIYVTLNQAVKVGSSPECDISIADPQLNPEHLIIMRTDAGFFVRQ